MGKRSRRDLRAGYARGEERNERIRQSLEPLGPGERPGAVTVAALVALAFAVANPLMYALGVEVSGQEPSLGGILVFTALMLVAAAGMWRARYWAVLGFQALLAIILIVAMLGLLVATSVLQALGIVLVLALGGWLFWKLVRALARLQMPAR